MTNFLAPDDRIYCTNCREFASNGDCLAARERRRTDVGPNYGPGAPDLPWRCAYFSPLASAEDQRSGRERYPELWAECEARAAARTSKQREAAKRGIERARTAILP